MIEGESKQKKKLPLLARLAFDMGPLAVFFIGYSFGDFFVATATFMASLFVSMALSYVLTRHLPIMSIVSGIIVAVFGGLTLFLHDETFFRMKPTIIYALFGTLLLGGLLLGKPLLAAVLGEAVDLTEEGWKILSLRWGFFFFSLAALNEV
ncbi:MAG: septation protein IspZ, partial [Pseudomonadota bacterium]